MQPSACACDTCKQLWAVGRMAVCRQWWDSDRCLSRDGNELPHTGLTRQVQAIKVQAIKLGPSSWGHHVGVTKLGLSLAFLNYSSCTPAYKQPFDPVRSQINLGSIIYLPTLKVIVDLRLIATVCAKDPSQIEEHGDRL